MLVTSVGGRTKVDCVMEIGGTRGGERTHTHLNHDEPEQQATTAPGTTNQQQIRILKQQILGQTYTHATDAHPHATDTHTQVTDTHPQATDTHPQVTDTHPQVTDTHPQVADTHPQATDAHPHATDTHPQVADTH